MKYRVHRLEAEGPNPQEMLESFLNKLDGEVVSVLPHVKPTLMILGGAARVDYYLIVEKKG